MIKCFVVASFILIGLAGCTHQEWMKSGATSSDLGRDQYECLQQALASAPPLITNQVEWSANPKNKGGTVQPVDLNEGNRSALADSCMQARGWQLVTVKNQ